MEDTDNDVLAREFLAGERARIRKANLIGGAAALVAGSFLVWLFLSLA